MDKSVIHVFVPDFIILLLIVWVIMGNFIEIQRQKNQIYTLPEIVMNSQMIYVWNNDYNWANRNCIDIGQENVRQVSIGYKHVIIRSQNKLWGVGDNSKGQLGTDTQEDELHSTIEIIPRAILNKIIQVSCGWNHTLLLQQNGCVYSAGQGINGALGHGRGVDSYCFKQITNLKNIRYISAGKDHSLALSSIKVYGWGNSMDGQLGMPKQKICYEPQQLYVYSSSICYAGPKYSIFKTQKGIYVTGSNDGGQLGIGNKTKIKMPKKINSMSQDVQSIGGSSSYVIYRTFSNQYYIAGTGCFGHYLYPTKVKNFKNCQYVLIGEHFGILKDQRNNLCTWNAEDSLPVFSKQLSQLNIKHMNVGPKMIVCTIIPDNIIRKGQNQHKINVKKGCQKNQGFMAKSSIEYSNNPIYGNQLLLNNQQNQTGFLSSQKKKSRKQSQAIQGEKYGMYGYAYDAINYRDNDDDSLQRWGYDKIQRKKQDKVQNSYKIQHQQINSPHFKKQSPKGFQSNLKNQDIIFSHRFSDLDEQIELKYSLQNSYKQIKMNNTKNIFIDRNKQNLQKIESNIQQNSLSLTKTPNNASKIIDLSKSSNIYNGKSMIIQKERQQQSDLKQKIKYLQRENKKKDQYIAKMKRQMIQLIQIVESDACMKNMMLKKDKNYLMKKRSQLECQFQQPDVFKVNVEQLRDLLGRTIDSLTYSK